MFVERVAVRMKTVILLYRTNTPFLGVAILQNLLRLVVLRQTELLHQLRSHDGSSSLPFRVRQILRLQLRVPTLLHQLREVVELLLLLRLRYTSLDPPPLRGCGIDIDIVASTSFTRFSSSSFAFAAGSSPETWFCVVSGR